MQDEYFLKSKRLGFRCWLEDDFDLALGLWGDQAVTRLIDARGPWSADDVRERLGREMTTQKEFGVQYWPVFLLETGDHVGCCGVRPYDMPKHIYEIGVHIRSGHWRQGYALEAVLAVMDHAFRALNAAGLFAGHNPRNRASRALLQRLGFRYTHDEFYPPTGLDHPSYLLEASDYRPL